MRYSDYKCFRFGIDSGVAFVSINHPPINLLDEVLSQEFDQLGRELEADESVRVGSAPKMVSTTRSFRFTQTIGEHFRNMPKVTIAKIEGRARALNGLRFPVIAASTVICRRSDPSARAMPTAMAATTATRETKGKLFI